MIPFRLDTQSGVPAYRQIVLQVKHFLRIGVLRVGDQLPTVKDVAVDLAINPNTVLRAYRDLEVEGLTKSRAGLGTFVVRTLPGTSVKAHESLRRSLRLWLAQAKAAGLDEEGISDLIFDTLRSQSAEGVA
jgi:GntR family transcriptional regulator